MFLTAWKVELGLRPYLHLERSFTVALLMPTAMVGTCTLSCQPVHVDVYR